VTPVHVVKKQIQQEQVVPYVYLVNFLKLASRAKDVCKMNSVHIQVHVNVMNVALVKKQIQRTLDVHCAHLVNSLLM